MKFIRFTRDSWVIIGIVLLMLVAVEAGSSLSFYIRTLWHTPTPDFRARADIYNGVSWVPQYYKEIDLIEHGGTMRWKSYVYWRRSAFHGQYVNINSDGLRKTVNVGGSEGMGRTMKIFMFGGSTLWGLGARDEFTIPSIIAGEVHKRGINCEVVNFGQYAYVSTQGLIELMTQLQKGNIPDMVIFYDGVNDTFSAFSQRVAGLPHGEHTRHGEFNLLQRGDLNTQAVVGTINQLSTVRLLNGVLKKLRLREENIQPAPLKHEKPISNDKELARGVVEKYLNNITLVKSLSESYGFKCLFYWQPTIYQKKHLSAYERESIELYFNYPGMKDFYLETNAALKQRTGELKDNIPFSDISPIFSDFDEPLFIDFNHIGEKGNSLIAQRMTDDLMRLVKPGAEKSGQ